MSALPYNLSDFRTLRDQRCVFADKSKQLHHLLTACGKNVFISRPVGFGMGVLFSLTDLIFSSGGSSPYLEGLRQSFDLPKSPVLSLNFARISCDTPEIFERSINMQLKKRAELLGITCEEDQQSPRQSFQNLMFNSVHKNLVILIQNYDAPLLAHIENPEIFNSMFSCIHDLFAQIKTFNHIVSFCLVSGVGIFRHLGQSTLPDIFRDVSADPCLASLVGFSKQEITELFSEHFRRALSRLNHRNIYNISEDEVKAHIDKFMHTLGGYRFNVSPATETDLTAEPLAAPLDLLCYLQEPERGMISQVLRQRKIGTAFKRQTLAALKGQQAFLPADAPDYYSYGNIPPAYSAYRLGLYAPDKIYPDCVTLKPANLDISLNS